MDAGCRDIVATQTELMAGLFSNERTIISRILFSCQASCRRQNISSFVRWSTIRSRFAFLFVQGWLDANVSSSFSLSLSLCSFVRTYLRYGSSVGGFFRLFFARRLSFGLYLAEGRCIVRLTTTFFDTRVFCAEQPSCGNRGSFPRTIGGERSRRWKIHVGDLGCLTRYNWLLLASYSRGPTGDRQSNESFILFKPRDFSR